MKTSMGAKTLIYPTPVVRVTTDDVSADACPECGHLLRPVGIKTVKHLLKSEIARVLHGGYYRHCPNPECEVVYVRTEALESDVASDVFHRSDLKDCARPNATGRDELVCYCFEYTVGEIQDDASLDTPLIPAAIAAEVRAGNCACEVKNPAGH